MIRALAFGAALTMVQAIAHADHDHGAHVSHSGATEVSASLSVVAARYHNEFFLGDSQGIPPAVRSPHGTARPTVPDLTLTRSKVMGPVFSLIP